jgi:hypothetical protein|tara:strand:- start:2419 stop:2619 length:201 start_codon:yes stop_codon:yes gene_type:complete
MQEVDPPNSYNIRGTYVMKFFVEIDTVVEAESEEEALDKVQSEISVDQADVGECEWVGNGPEVGEA